MTREQTVQQAEEAEGLTLRKADDKSGYANVGVLSGRPEPYQAKVCRGSLQVYLLRRPRCVWRGRRKGKRRRPGRQRRHRL